VSHRRKQKVQRKAALSREPTQCRRCGSTEILYGKKRGLCKKCRGVVRKPYGGWVDGKGDRVNFTVLQCNKCEKLFSRKRSDNAALPDVCPKCESTDVKVVETW